MKEILDLVERCLFSTKRTHSWYMVSVFLLAHVEEQLMMEIYKPQTCRTCNIGPIKGKTWSSLVTFTPEVGSVE